MTKDKSNQKINEPKYTPMMTQYIEIKKQHPDVLIFFRLGDFYELFFEDAKLASKELQLYLTSKSAGNNNKVPMCGIPHHAYLTYVSKLLDKGYRVGIVEQMEDPKTTKNLVQRDVVRIISPGANIELKEDANNFIGAINEDTYNYVFAYADLSTGEQFVTNTSKDYRALLATIMNLNIKEVVVSTSLDAGLINFLKENARLIFSYNNDDDISIEMEPLFSRLKDIRQMRTVARLYNYLLSTQKRSLDYFQPVINRLSSKTLGIDHSSRVNLELTKNLATGGDFGSLYWLLNHCQTPMGSRLLRMTIEEPSCDKKEIIKNQNMIKDLIDNFIIAGDIESALSSVYDLDRLIGKIGFNSCSGRELLQIKKSLQVIPALKSLLSQLNPGNFSAIENGLGDFKQLTEKLEIAISPECPLSITEGEIFKEGYNQELDELIQISTHGKEWLLKIEEEEKKKTDIKNLKIGYNHIFGYYIEVSNSNIPLIKPEYGYIRKQTLSTGERYITEDLKKAEDKILSAHEQRVALETKLFQELRDEVKTYTYSIQILSKAIAQLDMICSLKTVSCNSSYVRPHFNDSRNLLIEEARHPVIEKVMPDKEFVANDYRMDSSTEVIIITGPNMGGKSTYMRELALIVIMAQLGCYVPAKSADIPLFDNIFTRIGASDDLIKGQSTFMVEMIECNNALKNATSESLILFDEIGRGTATYDGMALAQSILEYLVEHVHAKAFFSTHYHEITSLVSHLPLIKNVHVSVQEKPDGITFLYKINEGPMDKSYGINVASLAGLPPELIKRSKEILFELEDKKIDFDNIRKEIVQVEKTHEEILLEELKRLDPLTLSPLEALNYLFKLKEKVSK